MVVRVPQQAWTQGVWAQYQSIIISWYCKQIYTLQVVQMFFVFVNWNIVAGVQSKLSESLHQKKQARCNKRSVKQVASDPRLLQGV